MKRRFPVWLLIPIVLILMGAFVVFRLRSTTLPTTFSENVESLVREEKDRQRIPGLAVVVIRDGKIAYEGYFGEADWQSRTAVSKDTTFRLASLAKPMTAAAVMGLVEQGKIDLDSPIQKYVPTFPKKQWPVTVRQLLGHLGGIRHYKGTEQFPQVHCSNVAESLRLFANDPLEYEPGTKYLYSTYGYSLLGAAIERVARTDYATYMQQHLFRPAGMTATQIDDITRSDPALAESYYHNNSGSLQQIPVYDTTCRLPGGGFRGPIGDVARFALAMMEDRLLIAKTREAMWTPQRTKSGEIVPYGLGWQLEEWNGQKVAFHNGAQPGVVTTIWMLPERKFAIILLANLHEADLSPLSPQIAELALQKATSQ